MPDPDEVKLIDYLNTLWKWKFLILMGTLVAALTAFAVSVVARRTYEATATLQVTQSKFPSPESWGEAGKPGLSPEYFETMIKNQALALQVIQQFGLDKEPFAMTATNFLKYTISVKPRRRTSLLTLTAILPEPKLTADVVNFVAQKAVELNARLNQADTVSTKEFAQKQRDQARQVMDTAQGALVKFRRIANLESLRAEQQVLLDTKKRLAQLSSDFTIGLNGIQSEVAEFKRALTKHEQLLTVTKSIFSDPAMLAAAQKRGAMDLKALSSIQLKNQEINQVYQTLQTNLIDKEAALASLESRRQDVERKISDNGAKLILIERKIVDADARLEELTRNHSLARATYELFAKKFDEASLSVASRVTELRIVDPAIVPTRPVGPKVGQNMALAGTVGLVACIMLAFFLEYLQSAKQRHERITRIASS